jgi:hypothetical protein
MQGKVDQPPETMDSPGRKAGRTRKGLIKNPMNLNNEIVELFTETQNRLLNQKGPSFLEKYYFFLTY